MWDQMRDMDTWARYVAFGVFCYGSTIFLWVWFTVMSSGTVLRLNKNGQRRVRVVTRRDGGELVIDGLLRDLDRNRVKLQLEDGTRQLLWVWLLSNCWHATPNSPKRVPSDSFGQSSHRLKMSNFFWGCYSNRATMRRRSSSGRRQALARRGPLDNSCGGSRPTRMNAQNRRQSSSFRCSSTFSSCRETCASCAPRPTECLGGPRFHEPHRGAHPYAVREPTAVE